MPVRPTMSSLITLTRQMIADPTGASQQFSDQQIQDQLDASRDDIRYLRLEEAPSIVNTATTNNQAQFVYADFYACFGWWEADVTLQGEKNSDFWKTLTPVVSDYLVGHWQFQVDVFATGVAPGQFPPVYITGKVYDLNAAAADLLQFWAAALACKYDVSVNGQNLRRSQLMQVKLTLANEYRRQAKPKVAKMVRSDVMKSTGSNNWFSEELTRRGV